MSPRILTPAGTALRRVVGGVLVLLAVVPFWRLLSAVAAPIATETVRLSSNYVTTMLGGTAVVLAVAALIAVIATPDKFERPFKRFADFLCARGSTGYAIALGTLATFLTAFVSFYIWEGKPVFVDALAHYLQARYFAAGMLAAPAGLPYEHWIVANTLVTEQGWVSQYPPGHTAVLALGFVLGAVWLVCPLLAGIAATFTSLTADRLLAAEQTTARIGSLLFAVSPFFLVVAASQLSHVTLVAELAVAVYCAVRARDEGWAWALAAGGAVGVAFATRPLSAVTIGVVVTGGVWLTGVADPDRPFRYVAARSAAALIGALPFVAAVMWYNGHFFAGPFEFGYSAYFGPNHGLGFHADPLGYQFGPAQGLGYTSSDLSALGYFLLRTPISAVLVVGVFLLAARRLSAGVALVSAWAVVLVVPLAAYWHHDLLIGPRMISDAAPAWYLLAVAAAAWLVRLAPRNWMLFDGRFSPRVFVIAALLASLITAFGYMTPRDVRFYAATFMRPVVAPRTGLPSLVFVHDSWDGRISVRLVASGMRADSVAVALARNSTCSMHEFAAAYEKRAVGDMTIALPDVVFGYDLTDGSEPVILASGVAVRLRGDEVLSTECTREAEADRGGTLPLMPIVWQGDLPGMPGTGAMFVRDLGPAANALLLPRFPRRRLGVLYRSPSDGTLRLGPYSAAMEEIWGPTAGTGEGPD